jgi:hypothetical protein
MGPNGKRIIEADPIQGPIIKQMFEWYATGQCSIDEVLRRALLAGLVTKHGFAFTGLVNCGHCGCALVAEKKKGKYVYYHSQATKENAPNLTPAKKCSKRALPIYLKDSSLMIRLWIGSSMLCIRATQTRNDSDVMRLLANKTNEARFRIGLISSTTIDLTDLSSLISLNARPENGDKLRSV